MKKIIRFAMIPILMALARDARAVTPIGTGPVLFNVTAWQQSLNYSLVSDKTNHTSKATNHVAVYRSSVTNTVIDNDYLINLLANSFNTNFPAGSKLFISGRSSYSFTVVDKTGTNLVFDVSGVFLVTYIQRVNAGLETSVTTTSGAGTTHSGNDTESFTEFAVFSYDDSSRTTLDGTHCNFQLSGILQEKWSDNLAFNRTKESVVLQGAGAGTIRDQAVVLKGTVTAALSSLLIL